MSPPFNIRKAFMAVGRNTDSVLRRMCRSSLPPRGDRVCNPAPNVLTWAGVYNAAPKFLGLALDVAVPRRALNPPDEAKAPSSLGFPDPTASVALKGSGDQNSNPYSNLDLYHD